MFDLAKLETYRETDRIEAKRALGGLPESLWETYSAFANTKGGVILLGVGEREDRTLYPVDLPNPTALMREIWRIVSDPGQVSVNLLTDEDVCWMEVEGKDVIVVEVPPAPRDKRPVYVGGDPFSGAYHRSGDGDYRLSREMVQQMLDEAKK
ncbi:MAG: ATP-binding protein [Ruminococcaceae bacterium]|nr:ATP-binding protein [Oscillospiraceae bacterium]